MASETQAMPKVCYRHPERETGLACSRCGKPICTECARATEVGYRCPDCLHALRSRHFVRGGYLNPLNAPQTRAVITYVLPVALGIIWLAQEATGGSENSAALVAQGASFGPLILRGEIWRLLTAMFLHIGWLHLLFNCFALLSLGRDVEAQYGYSRFGFIFLAAGYMGNLLSLAWRGPDEFSAGASGGVFGVLGAEMGFLFFHRHSQGEAGRARQRQLIGLIVLNLIIGLTIVNVNNIAHLGGLITGVGLGYIMAPRYLPEIDKHGHNLYTDQASLKKRWWVLGGVLLVMAVATWGTLYAWNAAESGEYLFSRAPQEEYTFRVLSNPSLVFGTSNLTVAWDSPKRKEVVRRLG